MIFNLFKSKPTLKDLIPKGFVDIHSHILPGVDDGAKNVEESLELITEMEKLGFSKIIGTPHIYPGLYNNTKESIKKSFQNLTLNKNIKIDIEYAAEYMTDDSLIEKIQNKNLLTIKDKYVLIETGFNAESLNLNEIIFQLQTNDYIPILAHPERYIYNFKSKENYFKLHKKGCKLQINLLSCVGYYGGQIAKNCDFLLKHNLVDFVGSDIHNIRHIDTFNRKLVVKNYDTLKKAINRNIKIFD